MKFYMFHLMPWPYLDDELVARHTSTWVTLPNRIYDPDKGADLYERYVSELAYAEELGFDGVCVNEHHQTAYGLMPSPNIIAAVLTQRVKRIPIAILGNAIPLRDNPIRVAEEIAMLDLLSKGRIISGFVRGIGAEYHSFSRNPSESRDRFYEAFDLILKCWTEEGPFEYYGKYYKFRTVNPWVRPVQQPYPPIWIPSQGSKETIDWTAERRYTYVQTYSSTESVQRVFTEFKEACRKCGYEASPYQMGWALPVYVSDTDERAYREAKAAVEYLFNKAFKMPPEIFFPPGYLTLQSMEKVLSSKKGLGTTRFEFEDLVDKGYVLVGSAETVKQKLYYFQKEFGFGNLLPMLQFGNLTHERTLENMKLFAEKVIPALRSVQ